MGDGGTKCLKTMCFVGWRRLSLDVPGRSAISMQKVGSLAKPLFERESTKILRRGWGTYGGASATRRPPRTCNKSAPGQPC